MQTALAVIAAVAAVTAVVVAGFAAWWSRQAARATVEAARKTEWGLNHRAVCDRLASADEDITQLTGLRPSPTKHVSGSGR